MKANREKLNLAMARKCIEAKDLYSSGISKATYMRLINGKDVKPKTIGIVADILNVDVLEIVEG